MKLPPIGQRGTAVDDSEAMARQLQAQFDAERAAEDQQYEEDSDAVS